MEQHQSQPQRSGGVRPERPSDPAADPAEPLLGHLVELIAQGASQRSREAAQGGGEGERYLVGITGGVAVGKSTLASEMRARLVPATVDVVSTDSFLLSNAELARRGIEHRKGFPESYDWARLGAALSALRSGETVEVPVYSHVLYDLDASQTQRVQAARVVLVEGLNLLQEPPGDQPSPAALLDLSIYLDAPEPHIRGWFVKRFLGLRSTVFSDPGSYFAHFADLDEQQAVAVAEHLWDSINGPNLNRHILPTRERADVVVVKGLDHGIVELRRSTRT